MPSAVTETRSNQLLRELLLLLLIFESSHTGYHLVTVRYDLVACLFKLDPLASLFLVSFIARGCCETSLQLATKLGIAHHLHLLLGSESIINQLRLNEATLVTALLFVVGLTDEPLDFLLVPQHPQHVDLIVPEQLLVGGLLLIVLDCGLLSLRLVVVAVLKRLGGVVRDDLAGVDVDLDSTSS